MLSVLGIRVSWRLRNATQKKKNSGNQLRTPEFLIQGNMELGKLKQGTQKQQRNKHRCRHRLQKKRMLIGSGSEQFILIYKIQRLFGRINGQYLS